MKESSGRLSALPCYFKSALFWQGALDPRVSIEEGAKYNHLREFSSAHAWGISHSEGLDVDRPNSLERSVIEVALGLLQRGAWAPCSWPLEQALAESFTSAGLGSIQPLPERAGVVGFSATPANDPVLRHALTSARFPSEVGEGAPEKIWQSGNSRAVAEGSPEEKLFYELVLVPCLGFPLLDFLRFQTDLSELGLDEETFSRQRCDFSIDTGRGLRLVIEVDGRQHKDDTSQKHLDAARDRALRERGWRVWRVPVSELSDPKALVARLREELERTDGGTWGRRIAPDLRRNKPLFNAIWGATVAVRIQFLVLQCMQSGLVRSDRPWALSVEEAETDVARLALTDFQDWFGRLRRLYSLPDLPEISLVEKGTAPSDLSISISVTNPHLDVEPPRHRCVAWSRPANWWHHEPSFKFSSRVYPEQQPERELLETFAQDLFRKAELREGQYEILARILAGRDVVGLLPTGGGKSLTYQLAALLLPGATLYVAPLKSLLQDQFERMKVDGVDACGFISSALITQERREQELRFSNGQLRMLQVAPERFLMPGFRTLLNSYQSQSGGICQVVVDECHCVSEWGHEFRPAYLSLSRIVRDRTVRLGTSAPVVALTGTASSIVLDDVRRELGVQNSAAIVRAKRLDRPELALTFEGVTTSQKRAALVKHITEFLDVHAETAGGLLVFSQHVNGKFGVYELGSEASRQLGLVFGKDIRIYSGKVPKKLAGHYPGDAWDRFKATTQRSFISQGDDTFQVLIATSAFGMGIDKPTIREVIHYLAPLSPEAYYQEVGRAARDRRPAKAVLLFSDEDSELTDLVLSPETSIEEARERSSSIGRGQTVGDFLTTFYFHASRFTGVKDEVSSALRVLAEIEQLFDEKKSVVLKFVDSGKVNAWNSQRPMEFSLVRLIHLGVVCDYTVEHNAKTIEVAVSSDWTSARRSLVEYREFMASNFESYVRRYETRRVGNLVSGILAADSGDEVQAAALEAIVSYLYSQIERRRRTSTRTMLDLARTGVRDADEARKRLLFYLQASEKFTQDLEEVAKADQLSNGWTRVVDAAQSPSEIDELRGAVGRVLESYPTHPGLLLLSAIARRAPTEADLSRSKEELLAALQYLVNLDSPDTAADAAEDALRRCADIDAKLVGHLRAAYGTWSYAHFGARFALSHAGQEVMSRMSIVNAMLARAADGLPAHRI